MYSKGKNNGIDLIKAPLLQLGKVAIRNKLLSSLFLGTGGIAAATASAPISLPVIAGLLVAYVLINSREEKDKASKQKILTDEFKKRLDEIQSYLKGIKDTDIAQLSHTLEIELEQEKIHELVTFLKEAANKQSVNLADITREISFTQDELADIKKQIDIISSTVHNIDETTTRTEKEIEVSAEEIKNHTSKEIHESEERIKKYISEKLLCPQNIAYGNTPASGGYDQQMATQLDNMVKDKAFTPVIQSKQNISPEKFDADNKHTDKDHCKPFVTKDKCSINLFDLYHKIQANIRYKNYSYARILSKDLEDNLENLAVDDVKPYIQVLLSKLSINCYEAGIDADRSQLQKAKRLLDAAKTHKISDDLSDSIDALEAIVAELEGTGSILSLLKDKNNIYAIRARIATLVKNKQYPEAVNLIEQQKEIHEYWAEPAILAYLFDEKDTEAENILKSLNSYSTHAQFVTCSVKYAEILSLRLSRVEQNRDEVKCRQIANKILEVLSNILQDGPMVESNKGVYSIANEIALKANLILADAKEIVRYSNLLLSVIPIPLVVLESILRKFIPALPDILNRIETEHKTNLTAHMLAAGIQAHCLNDPSTAFLSIKEVSSLAKTEHEKALYLNCVLDLYQYLDEKLSEDCFNLAMSLTEPDSLPAIKFKTGKLLRNKEPDKVLGLLESQADDPVILQMRGNAYLQKRDLNNAAKCFHKTAEMINDSSIYHKAGDLFLQANDEPAAIECYEKSISLYPDNIIVRSNLADIYTRSCLDLGKAIIHLKALSELKPNDSKILINLANCFVRLFEPAESLKYYDLACAIDNPHLAAIAGKAELLICLNRENEAFEHLEAFKDKFSQDIGFLAVYMNTAHYAGFDDKGHQAMMKILELQKKVPEQNQFLQMLPADEGLEMFKNRVHESNKRNSDFHDKMLKGQFPWLWAESVSGIKNYYRGWQRRTQELRWLPEEPNEHAKYSLYATNAFHVQKDYDKRLSLLPIKTPPEQTDIVVDISALITLHELNLLDAACSYFNRIIIPEEYLETVLEQGKDVLLHQKSRLENAKQIQSYVEQGSISIPKDEAKLENFIAIDEHYTEPSDQKHHICDLLSPMYQAGAIDEDTYNNALRVCNKPAKFEKDKILSFKQKVLISLSTLGTIAGVGLLKQTCNFFDVHIMDEDNKDNNKVISAANNQNDSYHNHLGLWRRLKENPKVKFIRAKRILLKNANIDVENALNASTLARENNLPLMADDRVIQALFFNESPNLEYPAFGTDSLINILQKNKTISAGTALNSVLQLIHWRYRFILVSPELLSEAALRFSANPPGRDLHTIAEYIQTSMSDPGLFAGREMTELGESMAFRLYLTYLKNIAEFIAHIWNEERMSESAEKITSWAIFELIPAPPKSLQGIHKANLETSAPKLVISNILLSSWTNPENDKIKNALKCLQKCFGLDDEKYSMIILDILGNAENTIKSTKDEKINKVTKAMQRNIMSMAFSHFETIGRRTLLTLQQLDLVEKQADALGNDIDPEILLNPNHVRRVPLSLGPLLVYRSEDYNTNTLVDTKALFCSPSLEIRKATFRYYEGLFSSGEIKINSATARMPKNIQADLLSEQNEMWEKAALTIYDALNNDFMISLAVVNQVLKTELNIKEQLATFVPKILSPEMRTLDFNNLSIDIPEEKHSKIQELIERDVEKCKSLTELCERYHEELGHLPLAPQFSLAKAVKLWVKKHDQSKIWDEIWSWANNAFGPLPIYHACTVFVLCPEFIPSGKVSELWTRIEEVLCGGYLKEASSYQEWQLRKDLNRHFTFYIEANLPDFKGAHIANFVLWLTERVSHLFGRDPKTISFYRKEWISSALDTSTNLWLAASPAETMSGLRHINHMVPTPWSFSLMCLMGDKLEKLKPSGLSGDIKKKINDAFSSNLILSMPFNVKKTPNPTYAFQLSVSKTISKWIKIQPQDQKVAYGQLLKSNAKLSGTESFIEVFRKITDKSHLDQMLLASTLKTKAFIDPAIEEAIASIIEDDEWRNKNFISIHKDAFGLIIEALSILQATSRREWVYYLPHYLADLCGMSKEEEQNELFFHYVIHTCLASDSFSAIRRLLKGKDAAKYHKYAEEYKKKIQVVGNYYPMAIKGRLRALQAAMNIC